MSQAGFGDSSPQESINLSFPELQSQSISLNILGETTTLFNALPRQVLEQELQFSNERSQQAQVLLRQAQEQLQLSQLVIQRQEALTQTLQSRIDQLERELQDVHTNSDELRDRLKRQQHHTSQLKAALERCLDTSTPTPKDMAVSALESWSVAKLAEEKISPIEAISDSPLQNVVKIAPTPQPIEIPESLESDKLGTEPKQPETMDEPLQLLIPAKTQPIAPLIVRTHKASQGSPISLELPTLQTSSSIESHDRRLVNRRVTAQPERQPAIAFNNEKSPSSNDSQLSSTSSLKNSTRVSTVVAPKFMQALYGNSEANELIEELSELELANSSSRKAVTSLASVQLPQFPPLSRR